MNKVASLPASDRLELFNTVASQRGDMSPLIVEKDFWVCWCLMHLFDTPWDVGLIFKGGTSLSKAYGLIRRFSEDVDLSLDRAALGFEGDREPSQASSRKQTKRLLDALNDACRAFVGDQLLPRLETRIAAILGSPSHASLWSLAIDPDDPDTILFAYPSVVLPGASTYIRQMVRLEIGARADHWPAENRSIVPYAAETLPQAFDHPSCQVHVLSALRTFWEKATILHAFYHCPKDKQLAARLSRHYCDLATMADTDTGQEAMGRLDLLASVAEHKAVFFKSGWANYETAKPGFLHLAPPERLISALARDYQSMSAMFFDEPVPFSAVIDRLAALEDAINQMSSDG